MTDSAELGRLAALIRVRNVLDREMAAVVEKVPTPGNVGEFIASGIFDIELAPPGVNPGHDGWFRSGPLAQKSVNVKLYSEDAALLDIGQHPADYYLVLTGPKPAALRAALTERGVGIGVASSVRKAYWHEAQVYPPRDGAPLSLTPEQLELLRMFAAET